MITVQEARKGAKKTVKQLCRGIIVLLQLLNQQFVSSAEMGFEKEMKHAMTVKMTLKAVVLHVLGRFLNGLVLEGMLLLQIFVILFAETQSFC